MPGISPSKKYVPQWYKDGQSFNSKNVQIDQIGGEIKKNYKNCVPFLETFTFGYLVEIPFDLAVSGEDNNKSIVWLDGKTNFINMRSAQQNPTLPTPTGHSSQNFTWTFLYNILLPKGYSAIFTHPLNRFDLPFTTMTGVVDADTVMPEGNIPFFLKNNFNGIIEAGTPFIQIIPFKRDDWKIIEDISIKPPVEEYRYLRNVKIFNFYKNNAWKKKNFD